MEKNSFLELTPHESEVLLPLVVQILQHRETKEKVFSNTKIRNVLKEFGEDISDGQIRKLVFNIRNNSIIELLIANHNGYFVANNIGDIRQWINTHKGKIVAMGKTLDSIEAQFERNVSTLKDGNSGLIGQLSIFDFVNDEVSEK
jgi:hypothetical protein